MLILYNFPTDKQIKTLRFITLTTGVMFEGNTKSEASKFIKENLKFAQKIKEEKDKNKNSQYHDWDNNRGSGTSRACYGSDNLDLAFESAIEHSMFGGC
ncbi:hypothetical protein [Clostridium sp. CTA-6]